MAYAAANLECTNIFSRLTKAYPNVREIGSKSLLAQDTSPIHNNLAVHRAVEFRILELKPLSDDNTCVCTVQSFFTTSSVSNSIFKYFLLVPMPSEGLIVTLLDAIWYFEF